MQIGMNVVDMVTDKNMTKYDKNDSSKCDMIFNDCEFAIDFVSACRDDLKSD